MYLSLLFFVAYWGQKQVNKKWANSPWVYSLSLGVSCTSWAFYGIIGQASTTGQWLAPIYIGTIGFFILFWPVLLKMLRVSKQQNLTSIADFIASRYERAPKIAALVSIIAVLGTIPYLALQLRAISQSFDLVTGSYQSGISTTFSVTLVLITFSILFGARSATINKQNQGLVFAIAFSSLIKLFAISAIGIFTTFYLFDGFADLLSQAPSLEQTKSATSNSETAYFTLAQILLGALTIFITPQLYHMIVIENNDETSLVKARWLYPLYLILINIFVLPIAIAGQVTFPGGGVNADTFILTLPLFHQQEWLSILVFIGGVAAATSMVIVAAIVLSTMLTTEIMTPALVRFQTFNLQHKTQLSKLLLTFRRFSIASIILLSFLFERLVNQQSHLSILGLLAFVLLVQFAPSVLGALYWRKANSLGAMTGLISGTVIWIYTLLLPTIFQSASFVENGLFGIEWLKPNALFGLDFLDPVSHGIFVSLFINTFCFITLSLYSTRSIGEKLQAELFLKTYQSRSSYKLTNSDLFNLLRRFIDNDTANVFSQRFSNPSNANKQASVEAIEYVQRQLASILGSTSTRLVMKAATDQDNSDSALEQVATIVDEASQLFEFNRELLQASVENIEQGISVIDADMNLVAWNTRYIELLQYPNNYLKCGMHISQLLKFNVERGIIEGGELEQIVERRIAFMKTGNNHYYQRVLPNGRVLEIRGQAMPGGGFVSTFSDITNHIETEKKLTAANELLEQRVEERTKEFEQAKAEAEAANKSKTRFLAAASHDLMQPFNALSLFTDMLKQQVAGSQAEELAGQIQISLTSVEDLLADLVEISKLDSDAQQIEKQRFCLDDVLAPLSNEIAIMANAAGIHFKYVKTSTWVYSDKHLLRRVIQNFLSNAIHYSPLSKTNQPRICLGVKRHHGVLKIMVCDNGPGIADDKQLVIFNEFERLEKNRDKPGLGLGLAIADRISKLLGLNITMESNVNKGSIFNLHIAQIKEVKGFANPPVAASIHRNTDLKGLKVLIIDNDALLLSALHKQLKTWDCEVTAVTGRQDLDTNLANNTFSPDFIIADYHLDNNENGVNMVREFLQQKGWKIPCIICSADPSEQLREHCSSAGFSFIKKPVKALGLKRLIKQLL